VDATVGIKCIFTQLGSGSPYYSVGECVEVLYIPGKEQDAKINNIFSLWGATLILDILGSVFCLIGVNMLLGRPL
jgi:hypothetical protein